MMPAKNMEVLGVGLGGKTLPEALEGKRYSLMYNPQTNTLLADVRDHAGLHYDYAPKQNYDDFVKMRLDRDGSLAIFTDRHAAKDEIDAWNKAVRAARAVHRAGFAGDTPTRLMGFLQTAGVPDLPLGDF